MQEEKDASEIFRKDLLQLSVEMIKKSKEKYNIEVIKNKALERKLENLNEKEIQALKSRIDTLEKDNRKLNRIITALNRNKKK